MSKPAPIEPLSADAVQNWLGSRAPHFELRVLGECESTNSVMMNAASQDDGRVLVVVAERQTAGRGRRGRSWLAWPGASLTFSVLWRFPDGASVPAGLSLVAGLALAVALEKLGVAGVRLKWPNDVLIEGRKLAGILVELQSGRGRAPAAVIGIGLNMALPAAAEIPGQPGVCSLADCLTEVPDRNQVLAGILVELQDLLGVYGVAGFDALRGAWAQRNAHAGRVVRILGERGELEGICQGVDQDGALLLGTDRGVQRILAGEVSLRAVP